MKAAACLAVILTLGLAAGAYAQGPPPPQPGPEHEILKRDVGVWDATIEMSFPGAPPMTMTGVETSTLMAGRWLVTEWESDMMGQPFEGHGVAGWDPAKKAYVGVWADSMNTDFSHSESTYDSETDTLTGWMEMPDPMGGKSKAKTEETWPDENTRMVKIFGPDGGPEPFMTFTYEKRK
jgi:hypothetical protein